MNHRTLHNVYLDVEFLPNDLTLQGTLSIALVSNRGPELYMVNEEANWLTASEIPFMNAHVLPHIDTLPNKQGKIRDAAAIPTREMRRAIVDFFASIAPPEETMVYAWCGAQDMTRLHSLWAHNWAVMPYAIPHCFQDLKALVIQLGVSSSELPKQKEEDKHHALYDARHDFEVHLYLQGYTQGMAHRRTDRGHIADTV